MIRSTRVVPVRGWPSTKIGELSGLLQDLAGLAGHPERVGNVGLSLDMDEWSVYWGVNYVGETDNSKHFGQDTISDSAGDQVAYDLVAESVVYHTVSASYDFGNGLLARVGVANLTDQAPPRLTRRQTDREVDVLGKYVARFLSARLGIEDPVVEASFGAPGEIITPGSLIEPAGGDR